MMFEKLRGVLSSRQQSSDTTNDSSADVDVLQLWSSVEVDGRKVEVFEPHGETAPAGCVLFLHGHGRVMLNDNETFSRLFQKYNLIAACPDGARSWWMDRICKDFSADVSPHEWLIETLLPYIEQRWGIESPQIALLGISMGGQGVLQLSYRNARMFPTVAAISPAVDFYQLYGQSLPLDEMFEDAEDARQATVVLNLHPMDWPRQQWICCDPADQDWFDGCTRLGMKLSSSGILYERDFESSGGGHSWDYFNKMAGPAMRHIAVGLGIE